MFPLLRQSFSIDVWVPYQARAYHRVRHPAGSKGKAGETFVAAIGLTDVNGIAVFFEWSAATRRATRCVVAKRHICCARIVVGLQAKTEEPVIQQCSA